MGTKMFQFPTFASLILKDDGIASAGLPHSDIRGSKGICPSPRLFAACHVLLRLREPRHPPCALLVPLYVSRSLRLIGLFFALPLLYRILPLPGASWSPRERLDAALVVFYSFVSARSVALPTPLLQYVNVLVSGGE